MPQNSRTTNDIIINAMYLIGELGVGETPDSFMLSTGLEIINELLDGFSSDSIYIPYLTTVSSVFVPGQDTYSISDILLGTSIVADRVIDLSFANYTVPSFSTQENSISNPTVESFLVDVPSSSLILGSSISFPTGTQVTVASEGLGMLPQPLNNTTTYFVINTGITTIQLANTLLNAQNGTFIPLLTTGSPVNNISTTGVTFNEQPENIVYPLRIINKATYYNIVRLQNLNARPGFIFLNKQALESFVTVYPSPDQPYPFTLQFKAMINSLAADSDISELPPYYYGFMKYAVARELMAYYPSGNWPQTNEERYQDLYNSLKNANETDLTIRPSVVLTAPEPFYWPNILAY